VKAGVTGHQELGEHKTGQWIRSKIEEAIDRQQVAMGFTSLAIGADQLFADVLCERHVPFTAVIPSEKYVHTFRENDRARYYALLTKAELVVTLSYSEPSEAAYMDARRGVVDAVDFLIAIWNGKPAHGLGGTADVVSYALNLSIRVLHINPDSRSVSEIL
jgi:hypothetical protein